jgi:hemoglobin-like flavoprotein
MNESTLAVVDGSLKRCLARADFLDLFYEKFLAASPLVPEKFARTDFVRQKRALRASLELLLLAAGDEATGPERYLDELARVHGSQGLDIGAELYDMWLDCLLETVAATDPEHSPAVRDAWEQVMLVGIHYMCTRYNR